MASCCGKNSVSLRKYPIIHCCCTAFFVGFCARIEFFMHLAIIDGNNDKPEKRQKAWHVFQQCILRFIPQKFNLKKLQTHLPFFTGACCKQMCLTVRQISFVKCSIKRKLLPYLTCDTRLWVLRIH